MTWSIDRFEETVAICIDENGKKKDIPRSTLPAEAKPGDILIEKGGGYCIDEAGTRSRRAAARLPRMSAKARRRAIERALSDSEPISASALAERFSVSRQVVVGDVALLRAGGVPVMATPRGYLLSGEGTEGLEFTVACRHSADSIAQELYCIVDYGGAALDVIVEHPVYGQITAQLQVFSRYDVDRFVEKVAERAAAPLSALTDGIHLHTVRCRSEEASQRIRKALREAGFLFEPES